MKMKLLFCAVLLGVSTYLKAQQISDAVFIQSANSNYNENLRLFPSTTNNYSSIVLGAVTGILGTGIGQWTIVRYPSSDNYLFGIRYNSTDYLNINNTGAVGLGTNPLGKLHIDAGTSTGIDGKVLIRSSSNDHGQFQILNPTGAEASMCFIGLGTSFGNTPSSSAGNSNIWSIGSNLWGNGGNIFGIGNADYASQNGNGQILGITSNGNVGIGTTNPGTYKLNVAGSIRANEIKVNTTGADFVFEPTYKLRPLAEVETFINQYKHLPDLASAVEMQTNGVSMGDMQAKLLQKVEELTLYSIEQGKKLQEQDKAKAKLEIKVEEQSKELQEQRQSSKELHLKLEAQAKEIEQLKQLITQKLK